MFDRFYSRVDIFGELLAKTALYIGAGQDSYMPSGVQGVLIKDAQSQPYIPGSSIKGVLRSFLESIQKTDEAACFMGETCTGAYSDGDKRRELLNDIREPGMEEEEVFKLAAETIEKLSCDSCRLFGSGRIAGKIKFADAVLVVQNNLFMPDIRNGVAIDRDTRTAKGRALFDMETIPAGTRFKLHLIADNLTCNEASLLGGLLEHFASGGLLLGGRSRSGLGNVSVENLSIQITAKNKGGVPTRLKPEPIDIDTSNIVDSLTKLLENHFAPQPQDRRKQRV